MPTPITSMPTTSRASCSRRLRADAAGRAYNAADGSWLKMGDYFDLVAESFGLPLPPASRARRRRQRMPETLLSFMRESRRLSNRRLREELRLRLRYPTVQQGIAERPPTSCDRC